MDAAVDRIDVAGELATLWRSSKPLALLRVHCLRRAVVAASRGVLDVDLRLAAESDARQLAGVTDLYGFDQASRIARDIDECISSGGLDRAEVHSDLRSAIDALAGALAAER